LSALKSHKIVTFSFPIRAILKAREELGLRRIIFAALIFLPLLCLLPVQVAANSSQTSIHPANQLGKVNFPTGCSSSVQLAMEEGLALLHSFQYEEAEQAFTNASKLDPQCALAYWGKAMVLYQQLWDFPNGHTLTLGRQNVAQAQKLEVKDPRIHGYIEAANAFFQPADLKPVERASAYSSAMQKLCRDQPEDNEACELYALSLIALAQMGVDDIASRKKAIAILDPIFAKYPNNPGAAHYLIHAADVRELAPQGLAAARAYAKIAPDSAHALHMPSHIFRRLGMWQEVIDSNLASAAAAEQAARAHRGDADYQLHAMDFLDYAYLQSGQAAKAHQLLAELKNVPQARESDIIDAQSRFAARNALELHKWKEAAALEIPKERLVWQDYTFWARAIGAARSGDVQGARNDVQKLIEIAQIIKGTPRADSTTSAGMGIDPSEAAGWLAYAEGKSDEALRILRSAADREDARDEEPFATPAREMLADLFLELRRPKEALAAYQQTLKNFPNRFDALYGAARAADALGERRLATDFNSKLLAICPPNADRPELLEAHKYVGPSN
jgi:tetratricopeptide (TPR) repeat protein